MRRTALALGIGALVALALPAVSPATHARPEAAMTSTFSLVPAFNTCTTPNSTHGPPLISGSCNPPIQTSDYLTLVAPDRPAPFNQVADGSGQITLKVTCLVPGTTTETGEQPPCPAPGDQADVKFTLGTRGVRCVGAVGQANCAGGAGSLFSGKVLSAFSVRITDHYNGSTSGPGCNATTSCPGTAVDLPFDFGAQCSGGACNSVTSADAIISDFVRELQLTVLQLREARVYDAGNNGELVGQGPPTTGVCPPACAEDDPASVFMTQGLFAP